MNDAVNIQPAMEHVEDMLRAKRSALQHLLTADPHAFAEHTYLLAEFHAAVRANDILQHAVTAPAPQQQLEPPVSPVIAAARRVDAITNQERLQALEAGGVAMGEA